ncbi:MAG TPA: hypothetical protein VFU55_01025 [Terracidiphilus sp.]|nr:hypothetical protein [Terracidiphilus sp.]
MSSPKFERVKRRNPRLAEMLDRLGAYIRAQNSAGQKFILPKLAAAKLGLSDGEAFVLLEILASEDILHRVYNLYCRETKVLLATVDDARCLDKVPWCDECDAEHDLRDLRVEVAFVPRDGVLAAA